jgi:transcription elongation factor Elf1
MRAEALAEAIIEDCEVKEVKRIILISCGMCGNEGEMEVVRQGISS